MNIDEAIKHCKEIAESCDNKECSTEHIQLAKWLEELKELRKLFTLTAEEVERMKEALLYTKGAYDGKVALGLGGFRNLEDYKQSSVDMTNLLSRIKEWQDENNN